MLEPGSCRALPSCAAPLIGAALHVRRFCSLFNSYVGLLSALEDSRALVMVAVGARGIAALRSAIEWTPTQVRDRA